MSDRFMGKFWWKRTPHTQAIFQAMANVHIYNGKHTSENKNQLKQIVRHSSVSIARNKMKEWNRLVKFGGDYRQKWIIKWILYLYLYRFEKFASKIIPILAMIVYARTGECEVKQMTCVNQIEEGDKIPLKSLAVVSCKIILRHK